MTAGVPAVEEDGPGAVPCEEAEAVHAGWRGQFMEPCEEAEAVVAGWRGQGSEPCEEAEAVHAGCRGQAGSAWWAAGAGVADVGGLMATGE